MMLKLGLPLLTAAACLLPLTTTGTAPASPEHLDRATAFSRALGLKLEGFKEIEGPDLDVRSKVSRITENSVRTLGTASFYRAAIPNPRGAKSVELTLCWYPVDVPHASAVLIAVDWSGVCAAAAVLDSKDRSLEDWTQFTSQLVPRRIPDLRHARSRAELERIKKRAKDGEDSDSLLIKGLLAQRNIMQKQDALGRNLAQDLQEGVKVDPKQADQLVGYFKSLIKLKPLLERPLGKAADDYLKIANEMAAHWASLKPALQQNDLEKTRGIIEGSQKFCDRCHGLRGHAMRGNLDRAMGIQRQRMGIGYGYYLVGHDLIVLDEDASLAQDVADALWAAVLLTDSMKPKRS